VRSGAPILASADPIGDIAAPRSSPTRRSVIAIGLRAP
jgi:hypothetical protein